MRIGDYEFERPLDAIDDLKDAPGLCAIGNITDSGACFLVGVKYSANVKVTIESLVADPSWQERVKCGQLRYGIRYTGDHLEEDLKQAMIALENQDLVTCILQAGGVNHIDRSLIT
ncbi:MAG: hypothetical protein P1R58_07650 [bacterium]|nr:hypothetical protein [bacterium]